MRNLELVIPFYQQVSNMSCWWASTRMILGYYGIYAGAHPSTYSHRFIARTPHVASPLYADPEQYGSIDEHGQIVGTRYSRVAAPSTWFDYGVPQSVEGLELMSDVLGLEGIGDVPAVGNWNIEFIFQTLVNNGPIMFLGNWNGYPHAIVVFGVEEPNASTHNVLYADPADGEASSMDINTFNQRISAISRYMFRSSRGSLNPLHYPNSRPLREFIGSTS